MRFKHKLCITCENRVKILTFVYLSNFLVRLKTAFSAQIKQYVLTIQNQVQVPLHKYIIKSTCITLNASAVNNLYLYSSI